jgi:NADH-quinone oxidoreductase subunit G
MYSIKGVDIMDCTHSNISISFRGTVILRIIPVVNDELNEDWITDKIRFFYDSLVLQRLLRPFF